MGTSDGDATRRGRGVAVAVGLMLITGLLMSAQPAPPAAATDAGETWGAVELPPPVRLVELEATEVDATGIPTDVSFRLVSRGAGPARALAERLVVEPDIELAIGPGADDSVVELQPEQTLEPGSQLHFSLVGKDGSRLGTWAFYVRTPVEVVSTLPRHERTNVPTNTGIEFTFDRDGVVKPEGAFSIEPGVRGRFERRGRTLSFVPKKPLQPDTIYRVTLAAGVGTSDPRTSTTEDTVIEFATRRPKGARVQPAANFQQRVAETRPGEPAIVEVYGGKRKDRHILVDVYRFDSMETVESALHGVRGLNEWPYREHAVDTAGMEQLRSQQARLRELDRWDWEHRALTLAKPLPAGWYLLVIPPREGTSPGSQLILQVSDLSTYAHVTTTSSLFWVNDVGTGSPVAGAEVSIVDGPTLGLTDENGLLETDTPEPLVAHEPTPLVSVHTADAVIYVPFAGGSWSGPNIESWGREADPHDLAWSFLYTDRSAYRSSDTINVWGMYRDRDDGSVPDEVELRLRLDWDEDDSEGGRPPSIATTTARPSAGGVYSGSLPFEDLPLGSYIVEVLEGDEPIGLTWVDVIHIIKPAYRLEVTTNRHAYLAGENVRVAVSAAFFDGTPVPSAPLTINSRGQWRSAITNATGRTVMRLKARAGAGQISHQGIEARPRRSEEGEIGSGTGIMVLPSSYFLDARVTRGGGEIRASGSVHTVDLERLDRQIETDIHGRLDPRGAPVPNASVTARVVETEWIRRQRGTTYDFITKKVIPRYEYDAKRRRFPTHELVTDPDGSFAFTLPAVAGRAYDVTFSTVDAGGRSTRIVRTAWRPWPRDDGARPYLTIVGSDDDDQRAFFAEGERFSVELRQGPEPQPTGGPNRYLFLLQQVGLRDVVVQPSPVHTYTFESSHAPAVDISAVRFTGSTYVAVPRGVSAYLDPDTRRLDVELSPDRPRYGPGETVELAVRTTRRDGEGVAASVVLRAVDEKLYAMRLAGQISPLDELYRPVWSGIIQTYATHLLPGGELSGEDTAGGGDSGGGGGRSDFRDVVLFRQVETDADGDGNVRFEVSDDLTSWRLSATAVSDSIEAGEATMLVPVGLPFFVEVVMAREFVVGDEAKIRLRAYGPELRTDEPVTFTVSAPTLGLEPTSVEGTAFKTTNVALPRFVEGRHAITVDGVARAGTTDELHDRLTRRIDVRRSRLEQGRTDYADLVDGQTVSGGVGLTTVVVTDAGRGRFFPDLVSLTWSDGPRADEALAAVQARRLLEQTFGEEAFDAPDSTFDHEQFQARDGLIALLPYSSSSESLSTLVAIATPDAVDRTALLKGFRDLQWRRNVTRERKLGAFVARAALGDDVLERLRRYLDDERLTTTERLLVGIGLAEAGDEAAALELERALLARYGQQLGPWVRLWDDEEPAGAKAETAPSDLKKDPPLISKALERSAELTALLSILAAAVGDDGVAAAADAYVAENPPAETLANLQRVAYISRLIERTPSQPASFSWQIDGEPQRVDLGPGESHRMVLTAPQREALRLEPVSGSLVVASSWREPLDPAALAQDQRIVIERTVSPAGVIRSSDVVEVTLTVDLGPAAVSDCYLVTEAAPSGIAPLREGVSWPRRGRSDGSRDALAPWSVQGQRVSWCVEADPKEPVQTLRYQGRVVNPGSYRWESTLVQSTRAPQLARLGPAETLVLGSQPLRQGLDQTE